MSDPLQDLIRAAQPPAPPSLDELAALHRLVAIAHGDSGQSRTVASLLLAWWNAAACGGFDLTELWGLSPSVRDDCIAVIALVARCHHWPDVYGLAEAFEEIAAQWRGRGVRL